jgi:endonuclease YncB( thermonuclease family)
LQVLLLITAVLGAPLWWITGNPATAVAISVGSHLFADTMTIGGVQLFWPHRGIAVFPGRDEYRVVNGSGSETAFFVVVFVLDVLFFFVSRTGFDSLLYRLGGAGQVYSKVEKVTDGDTISVEVYGRVRPVRLIGVDTPETVAPDQPAGYYGKKASAYTERELTDRLIRLEIPRIGDSEDAYGRTLAYVYLDKDGDGSYEHLFNEVLIILGLARTTTFSHTYRREFERLREEAEERGTGLWSACPGVTSY